MRKYQRKMPASVMMLERSRSVAIEALDAPDGMLTRLAGPGEPEGFTFFDIHTAPTPPISVAATQIAKTATPNRLLLELRFT